MTESVLIIVVQFIILSVLGVAALSVLSDAKRDLLLPAAPIFGAALLAVTLSTTSWFWPARWGVLAAVLVASGIVALAVRQGRRPWRISLSSLRTAALVMLVSSPGLAAALIPAWIVGDNMVVMPNASHDAYYFAAESAWLKDFPLHPGPFIADVPGAGNATPAYGPMQTSLELSVRIGQPMVHAALDAIMGTQSVQTVSPLGALWVLLVGPAAFVAARLLGARKWMALAAAALSACSAVLVQQAYQQNMDSLLGGSLAMLAIATVLVAMRATPAESEQRRWRVTALLPGRDALWPGVLSLAALVAVYSEYALFVGPALVGGLLLAGARGFTARLAALASIALLALVIAPTAWVRGLQTLLVSRPIDNFPSPYMNNGRLVVTAHLLGVTSGGVSAGHVVWVVAVIGLSLLGVLAVVGGLALAILLNRHRGAWIAMIVIGVSFVALLTYQGKGYTQYRTISLFAPLLILLTVLGWAELFPLLRERLQRTGRSRGRVAWKVIVVATVLAVVGGAAVNLRSVAGTLDDTWVQRRHVDAAYAEAFEWAKVHGGPEGRDVAVVDPDIGSQMWLAYTLRDLRLVSYPTLRPDYLVRGSYWDGTVDPYCIVGPGAFYTGGAEVTDQNNRFTLVHLGERAGAVVTPADLSSWNAHAGADGSMAGPDVATVYNGGVSGPPTGRQVLVLAKHLAAGQQVVLKIRSTLAGAPVSVARDGKPVATGTVVDGVAEVRIDLGGHESVPLQIAVGGDGTTGGNFELVGIDLVGVDPLA